MEGIFWKNQQQQKKANKQQKHNKNEKKKKKKGKSTEQKWNPAISVLCDFTLPLHH